MIEVYTDGSARNNPGDGGFGVVVLQDGKVVEAYAHQEKDTTNNRQEMKAILYALIKFGKNKETITVYSDSSYAINTFSKWMFGWQSNGWVKSDKKVPENLDLVQAYYNLYQQGYRLNFVQVRGHIGIQWNKIADQLATGSISCDEVMNKYGK